MAEYTEKNEVLCNSQASFILLNKCASQMKRLRSSEEDERSQLKHLQTEKRSGACAELGGNALNSPVLSAVTIMRMAEMVLSQSTSPKEGDFSIPAKAFGFEFGISSRSVEHLKHVLWLLDAAEKFSNEQYDQAEELLVSVLSSGSHPIERVITCYARYLRERIDVKKCRIDLEREVEHVDVEEAMIDLKGFIHACEQKLPLIQISNFAGIQTILDSVASAESIHFIDIGNIGRKLWSYWIVLMHALANRENSQLKKLKITAVCTLIDDVKEAGKLLSSFAESMNLPFVFKTMQLDILKFEKPCFESEADETVAVFMYYSLHCLSACSRKVEALLRGLKSLNPHVMVVIDSEENLSTTTFSDRFRGALSLSSATYDCLESCLEGDSHFINIIEKLHFQEIICRYILSEDDDGFIHHRKIDLWREYFARFGIMETELSELSMCQARLMIKECAGWSSCSLSLNRKSMLLGWNGVPLRFLSVWKFQQDCDIEKDHSIKL